jgi:hypothetical protein
MKLFKNILATIICGFGLIAFLALIAGICVKIISLMSKITNVDPVLLVVILLALGVVFSVGYVIADDMGWIHSVIIQVTQEAFDDIQKLKTDIMTAENILQQLAIFEQIKKISMELNVTWKII